MLAAFGSFVGRSGTEVMVGQDIFRKWHDLRFVAPLNKQRGR